MVAKQRGDAPFPLHLGLPAALCLAALLVIIRFSHVSAPAVLGVFVVAGIIAAATQQALPAAGLRLRARIEALWPWPLLLAGLFLAIAALSGLWAQDPAPWARRLPRLLLLAGLFLGALAISDRRPKDTISWVLLGAFALSLPLMMHFLLFRMDTPKADGFINRNIVVLTLSLWVVMAHVAHLGVTALWRRLLAILLFAGCGAVVSHAGSQTAIVALATGLGAFALTHLWPSGITKLVAFGAATLTLLMPLIVYLLAQLPIDWQSIDFFASAYAHIRLAIWVSHLEGILNAPVLGWGLDASRSFGEHWLTTRLGDGMTFSTSHHPHNAFLQFWFDLGIPGALAMSGLMLSIGLRLNHIAVPLRPYAVALFAAIVTVMCVSHGAYQSWWLASLIILIAAFPAPREDKEKG